MGIREIPPGVPELKENHCFICMVPHISTDRDMRKPCEMCAWVISYVAEIEREREQILNLQLHS